MPDEQGFYSIDSPLDEPCDGKLCMNNATWTPISSV